MVRAPLLLALLLVGCPRTVGSDAGTPLDSSYDPVAGNSFEGELVFDDDRMMRLDGDMLRAGGAPCREPALGRVYRIIDGDTVHVTALDGSFDLRVRLIGIDTPEVGRGGDPSACYADEATVFTAQLMDHLVWLSFDNECFDRFDRLLAYVHIGGGSGDLWERQILRRGFGSAFTVGSNRTYQTVFSADDTAAQSANVGMWAACF